MKSLNTFEIENLVQDLSELEGARLQEILCSENELGLGLYLSEPHWLWADMNPACPMLLLFNEPPPYKKAKLPIALFLNAHGKNLKLSGVLQKEGRIIEFTFGNEPDPLVVEIRLFPHGANIIVAKGEKRISFDKVKELKTSEDFRAGVTSARSREKIREEWLGRHSKTVVSKEDQIKKMLQKKREGLKKLKEDNEEKRDFANYLALGEWLKENQNLKVPVELAGYLQSDLTLAESIEDAFEKAKHLQEKYKEGKKRIEKIEAEISELEAGGYQIPSKVENKPKKDVKGAKFRTLKLEGSLEAYLGKSGKDNLALLRAAQPWDLWLHLRDMPGAHVIIRKTKNSEVPDSALVKTIHWLVRESASRNFTSGDIVEIQMQEVRFVRPIKGDAHGRVTVQEPKYRRIRLGKL